MISKIPNLHNGSYRSEIWIIISLLSISLFGCQSLKDAAVDQHYTKVRVVELRHEFNRTHLLLNDRIVHRLYIIKSQDWVAGTDNEDIKTEYAESRKSFLIPSQTTQNDCFYIVMQKDGGLFLTPEGIKKQPGWCFKNALRQRFENSIQARQNAKNAETKYQRSAPNAKKCEQRITIPPAKFCSSSAATKTAYHLCLVPIGKRLCKSAVQGTPFQIKVDNPKIQPFVDTLQCSVIADFAASKDIVSGLQISVAKQMIGSLGSTAKWLVDRATEAQVLHCLVSTSYACSTNRTKKVPCFDDEYIEELKKKDTADLATLKAKVEQSGEDVIRSFDDVVVERF